VFVEIYATNFQENDTVTRCRAWVMFACLASIPAAQAYAAEIRYDESTRVFELSAQQVTYAFGSMSAASSSLFIGAAGVTPLTPCLLQIRCSVVLVRSVQRRDPTGISRLGLSLLHRAGAQGELSGRQSRSGSALSFPHAQRLASFSACSRTSRGTCGWSCGTTLIRIRESSRVPRGSRITRASP